MKKIAATLSAEIGKEGKKKFSNIFGFNVLDIEKAGINFKSDFPAERWFKKGPDYIFLLPLR